MKYVLHINDMRNAHPWEAKAVYMLYTELVISAFFCAARSLDLYLTFSLHTLRSFLLLCARPHAHPHIPTLRYSAILHNAAGVPKVDQRRDPVETRNSRNEQLVSAGDRARAARRRQHVYNLP